MDYDLVIRNGQVLDPGGAFHGDLAVRDGRVAALGHDLRGRQEIDARGRLVLPGAIDGHVHMRTERSEFSYDDTFETASVAAAFGGVTTFIDQVQAEPGETLMAELDRRMALAEGRCSIDFAFHMNIREPAAERLAEIPQIVARGVPSFKWFMAFPGWRVPDDFMMRGMVEVAAHGGLSIVHAETQGVIDALRQRAAQRGQRDMAQFIDAHPPAAEAAAIATALAMAEAAGCRCLIYHNTCAEGVAAIRAAKDRGAAAHGEACIAWLTHTDTVYRGDQVAGLPFLVSPPIRDAAHQAALWRGLMRGDLDIISTDHAAMRRLPEAQARRIAGFFGLDLKLPPADATAPRDAQGNRLVPAQPPGGLETRLTLAYSEGVRRGRLSLERWVETCCSAPARLFDLPRKGRLMPGCDADIVIFDPEAEHVFTTAGLHSNTDHQVWDGWRSRGRVDQTLLRGKLIVDGTRFLGGPQDGRYLHRSVAG